MDLESVNIFQERMVRTGGATELCKQQHESPYQGRKHAKDPQKLLLQPLYCYRASSSLGFADEIHHIHLIFFFPSDIPLCKGIADYLLPFFFPAVKLESLGAPHEVFLEPVSYCYCHGTFIS